MRQYLFLFLIALLLSGTVPHVHQHHNAAPAFDLEEHVKPSSADEKEDQKFPFFIEHNLAETESSLLTAVFSIALLAGRHFRKKFILAVFYQSSYYGKTSLPS
ncbi:hypothetical protein M4D55_07850 [Metabacillus idriensis]|uniref:Uncharacterized protein n=1 Tax=Metabacillus idriensis TaxID=324768 RepID=A0A6I2MBK8_9BACI|nr:hypothetical protein [Metabacillus idriensis]MCM3595691.1 hypothetical protein [Metabacillus idriensis]MRX53801.1 hypothetical protein [Metabacillus idriensis]OHR64528.1 hypothetical protein HMPREF3291_14155 [Bacillus sp. HMSC76G11]